MGHGYNSKVLVYQRIWDGIGRPGLLWFLLFHIQLLQQVLNASLQHITLCFGRPAVRKLRLDDVVAKRAGVATLAAKCRGVEQTPRKIGADQRHQIQKTITTEISMLTFCKPNLILNQVPRLNICIQSAGFSKYDNKKSKTRRNFNFCCVAGCKAIVSIPSWSWKWPGRPSHRNCWIPVPSVDQRERQRPVGGPPEPKQPWWRSLYTWSSRDKTNGRP